MPNTLYYGDNLDVLGAHIPDASVDLVYLDPPFNSQASYNLLFKDQSGARSAAQIKAFEDTWRWDENAQRAYQELVVDPRVPAEAKELLGSFERFMHRSDMLAYLVMMAARLVELHRVLKPTGSLYLHCDPTASHYLKVLLDTIFGPRNFRNEIVWRRTASHNQAKRFGPIHDTILFYSRSDSYFYRPGYRPFLKGHVQTYFRNQDAKGNYWTNALTGAGVRRGASGQPWRGYDPTSRGRHWAVPGEITRELGIPDELPLLQKLDALFEARFIELPPPGSQAMPTYKQYLTQSFGTPYQDVWAYQPHTSGVLHDSVEAIDEDVRWLPRQGGSERLGYQTQKPVGVLNRIVSTSCPDGGLVLDPFCGCGTAVVAAQRLGRQWIGIDITYLAIAVMESRLRDTFGLEPGRDYAVLGIPRDLDAARALAAQDAFQVQYWAVSLVAAQPVGGSPSSRSAKRGADRGVDGLLYWIDERGKQEKAVLQVKSGHVTSAHIRDLSGVLEREKAALGLFITLEPPTRDMRQEAASAGMWYSGLWQRDYPRIQIRTIEDLLGGRRFELPQSLPPHAQAARAGEAAEQMRLQGT